MDDRKRKQGGSQIFGVGPPFSVPNQEKGFGRIVQHGGVTIAALWLLLCKDSKIQAFFRGFSFCNGRSGLIHRETFQFKRSGFYQNI
ncbi:hypothetical protein K1719_030227 [Acacia pycnantha]|nr:hypothetical protein K1719_030227 [Acacia pycnantha]